MGVQTQNSERLQVSKAEMSRVPISASEWLLSGTPEIQREVY